MHIFFFFPKKTNVGATVKAEEVEFAGVLKKRAEDGGGKIKVVDVAKKESEIEVKEMISLHDVIEGLKEKFPGLTHNRIPICNSASPLEPDFDALCTALIGTNVNCPVIVNCQVCVKKNILRRRLTRFFFLFSLFSAALSISIYHQN